MAGKRGNSEGTIRKRRDGRWEARVVLDDGTRKSLYGKTRAEVSRVLDQARRDREHGLAALNDRQTVGEYLTSWIERYRQRRRYSSYARYERVIRLHLLPALGKLTLSKLTAQQVETFYARKLRDGDAPSAVRFCHKVLRAALSDAVRLGLVHRNVASLSKQPRARTRKMAVYNEEQARTLLDAARTDPLDALIALALSTGMREGELLALKWQDVDLDRATLLVHANLIWTPEGRIFEEAKTEHSRRRIAMTQTAVDALRRHRSRQAEDRLRLGEAWTDLGLVFPNAIGAPHDATYLTQHKYRRLVRTAGLPFIRFHDLRHTTATLLLARGVNVKVVSEMLGRSNIAITLGIYGHVLPHMQQQAAAVMDAVLQGETTGVRRAAERQ